MKLNKPVLGSVPIHVNQPVIKKGGFEPDFTYSFKYYNQIKYFGFAKTSDKNVVEVDWFISLLDKLKDFANNHPEELAKNHHVKDAWRYHIINWESTGIPIKRTDLNWLPKDIIDNEEDFPFWQFQVSTARGRIVGFWVGTTFYIVLLDPLHNIQPSINFDYKVDDCYPLSSKYDSLIHDIESLLMSKCELGAECKIHNELKRIPLSLTQTNAFVAYLDDDYLTHLKELIKETPFSELVKEFILSKV